MVSPHSVVQSGRCQLCEDCFLKLKKINWLYKEVDEDSVDEVVKQVMEVANSASSKILERKSTNYEAYHTTMQ